MAYQREFCDETGEWIETQYPDNFEEDVKRARAVRAGTQAAKANAGRDTAWDMLVNGKTIGLQQNILWQGAATETGQSPALDILELKSKDEGNILPLTVSFNQPQVIAAAVSTLNQSNIKAAAGAQTAAQQTGNFPGLANPFDWGPTVGIVEWGAGAVRHIAEVDIINGAAINISASYVRVRAIVGGRQNDGSNGDGAGYVIGAYVSPGRHKNVAPQRTIWMGNVGAAPSETAVQPIPSFAKNVQLVGGQRVASGTAPALSTGWIRFWSRSDQAINKNMGNYFFSLNAAGNLPVPIPNGAQFFSIQNADGNATFLGACFSLAL